MTAPADSLAAVLDFLAREDIDDDQIYASLVAIDVIRMRRLMNRLARVEAAPAPRKRALRAAFEGRRSALKGRLYEHLIGTVLGGVRCFSTWHNVQSTTNELDLLIVLGPRASWIPVMRRWGSHCICECKYHNTHVTQDWVTKLNTVLQTHGACVGILFSRKGIASSGRGTQIRQTLQLLAASGSPRFILALNWDDLEACSNGQNLVKLLVQRYVEVNAGLERLGLAAS